MSDTRWWGIVTQTSPAKVRKETESVELDATVACPGVTVGAKVRVEHIDGGELIIYGVKQ